MWGQLGTHRTSGDVCVIATHLGYRLTLTHICEKSVDCTGHKTLGTRHKEQTLAVG
jgi:hypothetical protein